MTANIAMAAQMPKGNAASATEAKAATAESANFALFDGLICELHWTALQIGGVTCVLNARVHRNHESLPGSCYNLFPVVSPVVSTALSSWSDFGLSAPLKNRLAKLFSNLETAKQNAIPFMAEASDPRMSEHRRRSLQQLSAVWRSLSKDSMEIVNELEPEARWRASGLFSENTIVLGRFLRDAFEGKFDAVDARGDVVLPVLPQRRRAHRYSLQQTCKIAVRGTVLRGFAHDVSMYGMGLACDFNFVIKETVIVELSTARRFRGVVVWSRGGKLGIQFDKPLDRNDPLIAV